MYSPIAFQEHAPDVLHRLIAEIGLGAIVTYGNNGHQATHLPLALSVNGTSTRLCGHVAKANSQWRELANNPNVLATFLGPNAYITPQWYPSKLEHGRVVPTWNYVAVHAYGTAKAMEDGAWLLSNVKQLTAQHEGKFAHQWLVEDAPPEFIERLCAAIVGIEITVTRLEGAIKASQNRTAADQLGVYNGLKDTGKDDAAVLAEIMKR